MTRDEAIMVLKNEQPHCGKKALFPEEKKYEAYDVAIKALEQEPCEDCISREELLKAIDTWDKFGCDADNKLIPVKDCYVPYIHYDDVVKCVKGLPPVTPQPKTGHWIYDRTRDWDGECKYECSECGMGSDVDYAYCMRCGAKMIEPQESEE